MERELNTVEVVVKVGSEEGPAGDGSDSCGGDAGWGVLVLGDTVGDVVADLLGEESPVSDARAVGRVEQVASEVAHVHPRQPGANTGPADGDGGNAIAVREDIVGRSNELEDFSGLVVGKWGIGAGGGVEVERVGVHKRDVEGQDGLVAFYVNRVGGSRVVGLENGVVVDVHNGDGLAVVGVGPGVHDLVGDWVDIVQEFAGDEGVVAFGSLEAASDVKTNGLEELLGELFGSSGVSIDGAVESEKNLIGFVEGATDSDEAFEVNSGLLELGPAVGYGDEAAQQKQN